MDSLDTRHVLPPNPATLWPFEIGQTREVRGPDPVWLTLRLVDVPGRRAAFNMVWRQYDLTDWLNLDRPCVAIRLQDRQPALTLTLREISRRGASLQLSAHPKLLVEG